LFWSCDFLQNSCGIPYLLLAFKQEFSNDLISSDLFLVQPLPKGEQVLNFSDAEQVVDDAKLK